MSSIFRCQATTRLRPDDLLLKLPGGQVIAVEFFGEAGEQPPAISGTGAWIQGTQTLTGAGTSMFTLNGAGTVAQAPQTAAGTGAESLAGEGTWQQAMESFLSNAAEAFEATAMMQQGAQGGQGVGAESMTGAAALFQAMQSLFAQESTPIVFAGVMNLRQAMQFFQAIGQLINPTPPIVAPVYRGPVRWVPVKRKRKLYVRGRRRL